MLKGTMLAGVLLLVAAGAAEAQDNSPAAIVQRHVDSGGNIDALMADYADDAVVLQSGRALVGKAAIRQFYQGMFGRRAAPPPPSSGAPGPEGAAPPAGGPPKMTVDKVWQEGNVGFVSWHMGPVKATEEFVIRNGKIDTQSVFMQGGPPAAPQG